MNLVRQLLITSATTQFRLLKTDLAVPWVVEVSPPTDRMGFHLVVRGQVIVTAHENDRPMCLSDGDLIFVTRAMNHRFRVTPSADTVDHNIVGSHYRGPRFSTHTPPTLVSGGFAFEHAPVHPVLEKLPWCVILRKHEIAEYPPLELVVRLMCTELDSGEAPNDDTQLLLLENLVHYVFMYCARRESWLGHWSAILRHPRLGRALSLMFREPGKKWNVAAIADECGMSRAGLRSLFREAVGESPGRYLSRLRVGHVKELLTGTNLSLAKIAERVGYADAFSLSKAFKRLQGYSPHEYRQATSDIIEGALGDSVRAPVQRVQPDPLPVGSRGKVCRGTRNSTRFSQGLNAPSRATTARS